MRTRKSTLALSLIGIGVIGVGVIGCGGVSGVDEAPFITTAEPTRGGAPGGTVVTLTGGGFLADTEHLVIVGDGVTREVTIVDDTTLTFVSPPGSTGLADITVANFNGSGTLLGGHQYNSTPEILTIDRTTFLGSGGDAMTIRGVGFSNGVVGETVVKIGAANATNVMVVDDSTITATAGPRDAMDLGFTSLDIEVTNANGTSVVADGARYTQQGLFATTVTGEIRFLDRANGFSLANVPTTAVLNKMSLDSTGAIVGFDQNGAFSKWDPITGSASSGLRLAPTNRFNDVTTDQVGGLWGYQSRILHTINGITGVTTPVGVADPLAAQQRVCIADRNANSVFYISDTAAGLFSMSKADSSITLIRPFSGLPATTDTLFCKTAAILDGELYALFYERNIAPERVIAVHINISTGEVSELGRADGRFRSLFATPPNF